jgi:MFS family permease
LKLLRTVGKGTCVLAGAASFALCVLVLLADGLYFLMSYTQPVDTYTGQDWDRAASWFLLGILVAASALAVAAVRLPARYRHLRASARSSGHGVKEWLAHQQGWRLARMLMGFNCPIMIVGAVLVALVAIATSFHHAPAGALLWAAAGGVITAAMMTAVEVFLLRYKMLHRKTRAQSFG